MVAAMLTMCPHCKSVFRVRARLLATARGFVECGACDGVFNALDRLADEPAPPTAIPEILPPALPQRDAATTAIVRNRHADEGPRVAIENLDDIITADTEPPMPRIALVESDATPMRDDIDLDAAPSVLRDDLARLTQRTHQRGRVAWGLFTVLLLLVLAAQAAWYARSELLARFPQLRPHATQMCARLGCRLEEPVGVADIALVARDVRDHPQYAQTLLVNATLQNRGMHAAKFPVIQLGVYDSNGQAIGVRRFVPSEYLDRSIDADGGMPPGSRVHVVLEIADAGDRADSFEFIFL